MLQPVATFDTVKGPLAALLATGRLSPRDTRQCQDLLDSLGRPVRVGLIGPRGHGGLRLVSEILETPLPDLGPKMPPVAVLYGAGARTEATGPDGQVQTCAGLPTAEILATGPILLTMRLPAPELQRMSFLVLGLDPDARSQAAALNWAARRTEITLWCTPRFTARDTEIWARAPDKMRAYAYGVVTAAADSAALRAARQAHGFEGAYAIPAGPDGATHRAALRLRLQSDIAEATQADLDGAQVFLHRFKATVPSPQASARAQDAPSAPSAPDAPCPHLRALISEPLLYLKRRARALWEMLAWPEEGMDWPAEVLAHCLETTGGLRDRCAAWDEDTPAARDLARTIEEADDTVVLLQLEDRPGRAEDAAALLYQVRGAFEQALLPEGENP